MTSLIRHLFRDKSVAAMLLVSSFFIGVCALAPSLFVIIVLNKFLASGVTATLVSLAFGAVLLLAFELAFRQNRSTMIQEFNQKVFDPFIKIVKDRLALKQITGEQFKKVQDFFVTMPKLKHTVTVTHPKTKKKGKVVLEGMQSFF